MHNSRIKRISLAVCLALMPMAVSAAGLGKLTVISGLGEPLNAEVELSASNDELSSISARIATAEVFAEQGIERASALSGVRVEVGKRPDGVPVLHLVSAQPISDPFLDMLIQVEWASGRLLREYTALLDPPGYGSRPVAATAPAVAAVSSALPGTASDKTPGKSKSHKGAAASAAPVAESTKAGEIAVHKGDTLHAIAASNLSEGVSLEQMLVGLYHANKDAFIGDNMNRLKVGQILRVPPAEELQAVSQKDAAREIRVQTADWNAYRNKLAGMVAESAPARETSSAQTASGKVAAPAEDKSVPAPTGPRDVVKLSKSEAGDVKGRLTALQEETTAREKAIKESSERVAALEKQLNDVQKLLDIKNKALAEAQGAGKAATPPHPAAAPEPKPVEPPKAATSAAAPPAKPEPAPVAEKPPALADAAAEPPKPAVKKPRKIVRPAPPPPPPPGMFDDPLGNPLLLAGAGGLLALVGGAWFYLRNKRRKGLDSFEQGILTTGGLKPNTVFGNTAGGTVDTGNTSFLTDFGQGAAAGMIDTNDVDPIAEAEVYMAYGRDVQAEEILKDAISKEPKRHELHLKLLEIFANRKDNGAFETLAGELYAALGATDPTWAKVAEMGRKLEPGNPLYGDSGTHTATVQPESVDFDATMIQQPAADESAGGLDIGLGEPDTTLDFSLDEPAAPETAVEIQDDSSALDFDIGSLELPGGESSVAVPELPDLNAAADLDLPLLDEDAPVIEESPANTDTAGLDFALDLPETAAQDSVQLDVADLGLDELPSLESAEPAQADESAALSLDLPELGTEEPASDEALALDLPSDEAVESQTEAAFDLDLPGLELPSLEESKTEDATEAIAPDIGTEEPVSAAPAEEEFSLDIDFPALDSVEPAAEEASAQEIALELPEVGSDEVAEIQLDLPAEEGFDLDLGGAAVAAEPAVEPAGLDKNLVLDELPAETEEISAAPVDAASDLDFDFNVDLGESLDVPTEAAVAAPAKTDVPDLDLSGISLDLEDATEERTEEITLGAENESSDVDTKLDLVTAYIDMGDQEGARELLQEVIQEGGPVQRSKAQKLLDSLD